jgi:hypothetical protein
MFSVLQSDLRPLQSDYAPQAHHQTPLPDLQEIDEDR